MNSPSNPTLEQVISMTQDICSPPVIYNRLNDAVNHPRTSVKDISRIISEDGGLTARVLKLANSPLYGRTGIESISQAVTLLGTREIRDMALSASIAQCFPDIDNAIFCQKDYWRHSIACGVIAKNLAILLREPTIERYFVAGVLHDVGHLVLCTCAPKIVADIMDQAQANNASQDQAEMAMLGFDHAQLGAELLEHWDVPDNITDLIRFHHQPTLSTSHRHEATILHLADIICQSLSFGSNTEKQVTRLDIDAFSDLELPLSEVEMLVNQSSQEMDQIFAIMAEKA